MRRAVSAKARVSSRRAFEATRQALVARETQVARPSSSYRPMPTQHPRRSLGDLELVAHVARRESRASRGAFAAFARSSRQVETFGFHLARLDVRVPAVGARSDAHKMVWDSRRTRRSNGS